MRRIASNIVSTELQTNIQSRQKLESQQQENKGVQKVRCKDSTCGKRVNSVGIFRIERWCKHLQAGRAGAVKARQDGSSTGCWWKTRIHWERDV